MVLKQRLKSRQSLGSRLRRAGAIGAAITQLGMGGIRAARAEEAQNRPVAAATISGFTREQLLKRVIEGLETRRNRFDADLYNARVDASVRQHEQAIKQNAALADTLSAWYERSRKALDKLNARKAAIRIDYAAKMRKDPAKFTSLEEEMYAKTNQINKAIEDTLDVLASRRGEAWDRTNAQQDVVFLAMAPRTVHQHLIDANDFLRHELSNNSGIVSERWLEDVARELNSPRPDEAHIAVLLSTIAAQRDSVYRAAASARSFNPPKAPSAPLSGYTPAPQPQTMPVYPGSYVSPQSSPSEQQMHEWQLEKDGLDRARELYRNWGSSAEDQRSKELGKSVTIDRIEEIPGRPGVYRVKGSRGTQEIDTRPK